jgi:hypothetical protein
MKRFLLEQRFAEILALVRRASGLRFNFDIIPKFLCRDRPVGAFSRSIAGVLVVDGKSSS